MKRGTAVALAGAVVVGGVVLGGCDADGSPIAPEPHEVSTDHMTCGSESARCGVETTQR